MKRISILYIILWLLCVHHTYAQFKAAGNSYTKNNVFTRFTKQDGLSSKEVYAVYQDEKGFIWIGTANGLDLYDGIRFHHYQGWLNSQLPRSAVYQILKDKRGNLWLRNDNEAGIFDPVTLTYKPAAIHIRNGAPRINSYDLWADRKGDLFLTLEGYTVLKYNQQKNAFEEGDLPFIIPDNWKVNQVNDDPGGKGYWICGDNGLAFYDNKKGLFYDGHNPDHNPLFNDHRLKNVKRFFVDAGGAYWISIWTDKLHLYTFTNQKVANLDNTLPEMGEYFDVDHFYQQQNGQLWISGPTLLSSYNEKTKRFTNHKDNGFGTSDFSYYRINQLLEDREQNLWVASDEGLYVLPSQSTRILWHDLPTDKHNIHSNALLRTTDGKILVGTWGAGIFEMDSGLNWTANSLFHRQAEEDENFNLIWDLWEDKESGNIWAGCQKGHIRIFDRRKNRVVSLNPPAFANATILQIKGDQQGNIWMGTAAGRLVKGQANGDLNERSFKVVADLNATINSLLIDSSGLLWVGTKDKGLFEIDPGTEKILRHYTKTSGQDKSLSGYGVTNILQYNDSLLFIVQSSLDVVNLKTGKIEPIHFPGGTDFNRINLSALDREGNLWMCTPDVIYKYNFKSRYISEFGADQGFFQTENLKRVSLLLPDGSLMFGNVDNVIVFDPRKTSVHTTPPQVRLNWFRLFDHFLSMDSLLKLKTLTLDHDQNSFTIYFSSLAFLQRNRLNYYYKLQGEDEDWRLADPSAYCSYNSLPPGHYTLLVKCVNTEGISSEKITALSLYISPPFWNTWWFISLVLLSISAVIYYIYHLRIKRLVEVHRIRSKVSRDLHDDMGATLTTIGILSEMAKNRVNGNVQTRELIEKISDNSTRMMEAMSDIVWSINPNNDSMQKIVARMREYASTVMDAKNIDYRFHVDEEVYEIALDMEKRRDLFLIFKESVNNLVKYSQCTFADISISRKEKRLIMLINDNGMGFDMKNHRKGNGLLNIRKRAKIIQGVVEINSTLNKGTQVQLEVPV